MNTVSWMEKGPLFSNPDYVIPKFRHWMAAETIKYNMAQRMPIWPILQVYYVDVNVNP